MAALSHDADSVGDVDTMKATNGDNVEGDRSCHTFRQQKTTTNKVSIIEAFTAQPMNNFNRFTRLYSREQVFVSGLCVVHYIIHVSMCIHFAHGHIGYFVFFIH